MAFSRGTVIDVAAADSKRALHPEHTVVVSGGRITAVEPANTIRVPAAAVVIDAPGKFLMPGLWDMHAHLLAEDRLGDQQVLYIANGVTGVRVMGSAVPLSRILKVRTAFGPTPIEHSGSAGSTPAELLMSCSSEEDALRQVAPYGGRDHRSDAAWRLREVVSRRRGTSIRKPDRRHSVRHLT